MPRNVTITLQNGTTHTYRNVPDNVTPGQIEQRAAQQFPGIRVTNISGGRKAPAGSTSRAASFGAGFAEALPRTIMGAFELLDKAGRVIGIIDENTPRASLTPAQKQAYDRQFDTAGRRAHPNYFTAGQIAGETAVTAPIIGAGAGAVTRGARGVVSVSGRAAPNVFKAARVVERGAKAVSRGGIGVQAPTRTGRMALRAVGGGTAAAAQAALTDQDIVSAAETGAVVPIVGAIGKHGLGWTYDLITRRLGETKAAEIMRRLAAENLGDVRAALEKASGEAKANTAQFLSRMGIDIPELSAATQYVARSTAGEPLATTARARGEALEQGRTFLRGGETGTVATGQLAAEKQALRGATGPMRETALAAADVGRTQIAPAEQRAAALRSGVQRELDTATRYADDPNWSPSVEQRLAEARSAEEVAANLRDQGLQPLDVSGVVGRLRAAADEAANVVPDRARVLSAFADNLENRARQMGGYIDATGLYNLRKNMGATISGLLPGVEPKALQAHTAQIIGETQPLIDDAIEAAGGAGWRDYLNTFAEGMRKIERQQFTKSIADLPEEDYVRVMRGDDPERVAQFFGPGRFDVNVEMMGPKLPAAQGLAGDIQAGLNYKNLGLGGVSGADLGDITAGIRNRARSTMETGVPNVLFQTAARMFGGGGGIYGGGIAAERLEREYANKLYENVLRRLAPAMADPTEAARLLQAQPTQNIMAEIFRRSPELSRLTSLSSTNAMGR